MFYSVDLEGYDPHDTSVSRRFILSCALVNIECGMFDLSRVIGKRYRSYESILMKEATQSWFLEKV